MNDPTPDVLTPFLDRLPATARSLLGRSRRATTLARDVSMLLSSVLGPVRPVAQVFTPLGEVVLPGERALRVLEVRRETPDAVSLVIERPASLGYEAGQFLTLLLSTPQGAIRRSYSLSSSPHDNGPFVITVKRVEGGQGSTYIHDNVRAGTLLRVRGPSGSFVFSADKAPRRLVLIGGGSGITPLMGIVRTALASCPDLPITLLYANRDEQSIIFARDLEALAARSPRLEITHFLEKRGATLPCREGRITDQALAELLAGKLDGADVYLCGPTEMMSGIERSLHALGCPRERLHIERFVTVRPVDVPHSKQLYHLRVGHRTVPASSEKTLLESAQAGGVDLDFSCTMGGCGACKCRLASGEVVMDTPNCLTDEERDQGYVLTCISRPLSDVTLERKSLSRKRAAMTHLPQPKTDTISRLKNQADAYGEAAGLVTEVENPAVLLTLLPSAARGFLLKRGKQGVPTLMPASHNVYFDWSYQADMPQMRELYRRAKQGQWDAEKAVDWSTNVDPENPEIPILPREFFASERLRDVGVDIKPDSKEDLRLRHDMTVWMLSQFLHGEQGALHAAAQVTECVRWMDGKFYGATQVMDEARHVEVFHRYLSEKLCKLYDVNDNLFVIIDALMHDSRWDMKFLGMQIMIEGLALGAFGLLYKLTHEPLLKEILKYVIQDEARHVHYGVIALREHYSKNVSEKELRERQDWAFELSLLMRNRFMAHEVYEERFQGLFSRKQWNDLVLAAPGMTEFRHTMFERLVPNLRYIGLLDARMAKHYADAGMLRYADGKNASELTGEQMLAELDARSAQFFKQAAE